MRPWLCILIIVLSGGVTMAAQVKVDVNSMLRIVFTGDSQTVGCVGAMDYAQMISWEVPLRVFNRSVGGSNTSHLLSEFHGGTVSVKAGEFVVEGDGVGWYAGPYIGQRVRIARQEYAVDAIETLDYVKRICRLYLTEPAREDYTGTDYMFEPGWRVRIADVEPHYACFMFTVNDPRWESAEFKARLAEIVRRCRDAGIQPLFLSGVPFMDAESGGSHAGAVSYTGRRAQDLLEFCLEEKLPYGDVYRTLDLLDPQRTSVWADTIHPTNDGSIIAVHALRYLLRQMGATGNPYSVHGYRAPDVTLPDPRDPALQPITTAQPRRDRDNQLSQTGHNLEAQRIRDEYGLIAHPDGESLTSSTPLVFKVGVGPLQRLEAFDVHVTLGAPGEVHIYDWAEGAWIPLAQAPDVPPHNCVHKRAIWVGVSGEAPAVDYLAVTLTGDVRPWQPRTRDRAIVWPPEGQFEWAEAGNLLPNADLTQADGDAPAGWASGGGGAVYLPEGVVTSGTGEFAGERRDRFTCAGAQFTQTVRPLDMLVVDAEVQDGGNFLVERVIDDETLDLRRSPKEEQLGAVPFEVQRWSGLRAVPGGCCIEVAEGSSWRTSVYLPKGRYRFGFFYRCFNPGAMKAAAVATSRVDIGLEHEAMFRPLRFGHRLDSSYVWLREWKDFDMVEDGELRIEVGAQGPDAMQYTGFSVEER